MLEVVEFNVVGNFEALLMIGPYLRKSEEHFTGSLAHPAIAFPGISHNI